jgi:hypothetical protein
MMQACRMQDVVRIQMISLQHLQVLLNCNIAGSRRSPPWILLSEQGSSAMRCCRQRLPGCCMLGSVTIAIDQLLRPVN